MTMFLNVLKYKELSANQILEEPFATPIHAPQEIGQKRMERI